MRTPAFLLSVTRRADLTNEPVAIFDTYEEAKAAGRFYLTAPECAPYYARAIIRPCMAIIPGNNTEQEKP